MKQFILLCILIGMLLGLYFLPSSNIWLGTIVGIFNAIALIVIAVVKLRDADDNPYVLEAPELVKVLLAPVNTVLVLRLVPEAFVLTLVIGVVATIGIFYLVDGSDRMWRG